MKLKEVLPLIKSEGVATEVHLNERDENIAIEEPYDKYSDYKVIDICYTDYSDEYGKELTVIIEKE